MGNTAVDTAPYDDPDFGYVRITWDNSDESAGHEAWRVYRRDNTVSGDWVLVEQVDTTAASYTVDDYLAPANRDVDYAVVEVTTGNVEGSYTAVSGDPVGTNYWIIDTEDSALSFRIEHVTGDSFNDEYEEETIELIGRGRKKDQGTRWGYAGKLDLQIRAKNGRTALEQVIDIRTLRAAQHDTYLRTPFGDVFKASMGNVSFDRLEGSGTEPWYDVSFPYEELA